MKDLLKKFIKNFKEYINYLMKVNFKQLFVNTIIILCIVLLSALIYVPVGIIQDLIRSFIVIFVHMVGVPALLFTWIFRVIGALSFVIAFMILFNKRFEDLEAFKNQVDGKDNKVVKVEDSNKDTVDVFELPKEKSSK